jgi:hypothetical protein
LAGEAFVNIEIFDNFRGAQAKIKSKDCASAKVLKDAIVSLMTVPLVQGTIRYAHLLAAGAADDYWEPYGAQAAAFAAAVLPLVHHCDPDAAKLIHDNLKTQNKANVNFIAVKRALERNYACLKVTCTQVGGIYNPLAENFYFENAQPCIEFFGEVTMDINDNDKNLAMGLGIALGGLVVLACAVVGFTRYAEQRIKLKNPPLEEHKDPNAEIL